MVIWEEAVIGTALQNPESVDQALELMPSDFTGVRQLVWQEIVGLYRGQALSPQTLSTVLGEKGILEILTSEDGLVGDQYIAHLVANGGTGMEFAVGKVIDASVRRDLRRTAGLIELEATDEGITAEEALKKAQDRVLEIRHDRAGGEGTSIGDLMAVFIPRLDGMIDGTVVAKYTPSLPALRNMVEYVEDEDYFLVAGRPGEGKSSFVRFEAFEAAVKKKIGVVIVNMDNSQMDYARSMISLYTGIDASKIRSPKRLDKDELRRVREAAERMSAAPLYIHSMSGPNVAQVEAVIRRRVMQNNVSWAAVDYVQLMQNGAKNPTENVTMSSQGLRGIGQKYSIPMIGVAQLSREIVHRGENAEPQLSDLRESGSLEQDGTIITFIRDLWTNPDPSLFMQFDQNKDEQGKLLATIRAKPVVLKIKKNRNGPTGTSDPILWDMATGKMVTLRREH